MTYERWEEITGRIKDSFKIEDQGKENIEEEGGLVIEYVIFTGPLGRMKLELVSKPVILDKKVNFSKRIGSHSQVEYIYSETEKNYKFTPYKWDDVQADWLEIDAKNFE